ncbi:MAG: recombinase family protein [Pseudomonadota bacterium]
MNQLVKPEAKIRRAVIYARVSSPAQVKRGHGLGSQESRCRDYAARCNYTVDHVFRDEGISGGLIDRPGMQDMLKFLKSRRRSGSYVVLIDDISRLARSVKAHLDLRDAISDAGGKLESPSIEFGTDSDSILVENLLASVSQHQRQKNAEQVVNRMKARVNAGYYVFAPVVGYRYGAVEGHGRMLVRDEPNASIVAEALEGFASGRFQSPSEVKRFLDAYPTMPKSKYGDVRLPLVIEMLQRPLYAGYISVEKWNVHLLPGKHDSLISFATWKQVQERLNGRAVAPFRQDIRADFPLRGFVTCARCNHPMTSAWTKGRSGRYPYYFCHKRTCPEYRKSIKRDDIEGAVGALLQELQPSPLAIKIARKMFADAWDMQHQAAGRRISDTKSEIAKIDRKMGQLMDRLLAADSDTLVAAYEAQIKKLEEDKILMNEQAAERGKSRQAFEDSFRTARKFLENPWKLWVSDLLEHKRMVLRLAFLEPLSYCRKHGVRTAKIAEPFRVFGDFCDPKFGMVGLAGLEPATTPL